ncbi:MAG: hypothetical protein HC853_13855 [Anaerolineae bacterium]|nr:hypothetical protein [Anaerolineae bacterium]
MMTPTPQQTIASEVETRASRQITRANDIVIPTPIPFKPGQARTEFGIQIHGCGPNHKQSIRQAKDLGFTWIKQQVRWGDMSARPGQMDWSCLDTVIPTVHERGLKVLLSLTTAPTYLRVSHDKLGFPNELSPFAYYVYELLTRYRGQVHAIEVWNEPNIDAEVSDGINYARYTIMLSLGYAVAKTIDPHIMVISAGLAPVDFDSFYTAVDDVSFLKGIAERGAYGYMDCIGAHANGPPGRGDLQPLATQYHALSGYTKPICVTEFGYALPVRGQLPCGFGWAKTHTTQSQAKHLIDGMAWARASGITRLVIVWNLDVYSTFDARDCNAPYALSRADWQSPALPALKSYLRQPK